MFANSLEAKGRAFGQFMNPTRFQVSCRNVKSEDRVSGSYLACENGIPTPTCSAIVRLPYVKFTSKDSDRGRHLELAIRLGLLLKRSIDVVLSTIALIFLWPLMLLIAIAIKLESGAPVIYSSLRLGEERRTFACYKFRTMVPGADGMKDNLRRLNERRGPFFKIADDPRVTQLGRFLRKYSLDELPQFWNVLKGDMSLVGPRPHPVEDCAQYTSEHCRRLRVKPGVTGLWQVLARANPSFEISMILDLAYIEKWSLLLDCRILDEDHSCGPGGQRAMK